MESPYSSFALYVLFTSLASQVTLVNGNQYDPHLFPAVGPFMEGWYARMIDFESNHSFGILFGQVLLRREGPHFKYYPLNMLSFIHSKGDGRSMESFAVYPPSEDIEVTVQGKPVTSDPDFKSPANFEWKAKPYGYFRVNENETRFNFTNVEGVSFIGVLGPPQPWGPDGEGPEGWLDHVPFLPLHWKKIGETVSTAWIWAEGVDGPSGSSFAVSLGVLGLETFEIPAHLIGYRSSAVTLNFKPTDSVLTKYIDGCNGSMNATVTGLVHKLEFEIHAPPSTLQTCLLGPTLDGFAPVCVESYIAIATFHVYKLTLSGYELVETRTFNLSALEFGGIYLCQEKNPCQTSGA
ncbi:hypothetical protein OS493_008614 [Desmophyllum pertusum]|uniref:Uncharacterized protein n=1 Tax=Desmophyllum pertusum TaxID=174260 RepID=A0A9W9ZRI4_9CNID|nr:hypothetical protein OS493_008614 [Desmophyllum pertusum]